MHISRDQSLVLRLVGAKARLVTELVLIEGPASWEVVAREVWPGVEDPGTLRRRWDICLSRLRQQLRGKHIRTDLIKADGRGNFELVLHPGDVAIDRA